MSTAEKIKVLYVDDEPNNLLSFQASFRRIFDVYIASSAAEGISVLNENNMHVVIADQRMPVTTGVEFLNIVRTAYPNPVRILLTGYTDIEALIDAINKGEIHRYIKKPWDEYELQTAIKNAYEIYSTREQLRIKIDELQKTNDELNRFVYSTSHDLRSPLSSALGIINLARLEQSVSDPNNYLGMIESCITRMDSYVKKVIEYYKSVRVEEQYEVIDIEQLLNDSIQLFRMQNLFINFRISVKQHAEFKTDAFRLAVIIDNLLSNAVKYQKPEEVHPYVNISAEVTQDVAVIAIEDNGMGILEEHLNNVFKMFFRSNTHPSVNGLGIGLYIVKEALTRLGGTINVRSALGQGTTFEIILPNKNG
jgi:two-component system, sensor histidine kinase and response regulator